MVQAATRYHFHLSPTPIRGSRWFAVAIFDSVVADAVHAVSVLEYRIYKSGLVICKSRDIGDESLGK